MRLLITPLISLVSSYGSPFCLEYSVTQKKRPAKTNYRIFFFNYFTVLQIYIPCILHIISGVRVALSLVFCIMFCRLFIVHVGRWIVYCSDNPFAIFTAAHFASNKSYYSYQVNVTKNTEYWSYCFKNIFHAYCT